MSVKDAQVTISDGETEVITTVGELGELGKSIARKPALDPDSNVGITTQLATKEQLLEAIRQAINDVAVAKSRLITAKQMRQDEVENLDEWLAVEEIKADLKMKNEALKQAVLQDDNVLQADEKVAEEVEKVGHHKAILSALLVLYAAKFNSKTVEVEGENRLIILSAKIGKVEPEQLMLF